MKTLKFIYSLLLAAGLGAVTIGTASGANGTWTNASGGLWTLATNWSGSIIADGSSSTANFNTLNIASDVTVGLNGSRTIGNIIFGDTDTATAAGWLVSGSTLTLAGGTPTVTVNALGAGKSAEISSIVAGTAGLTKAGAGTLVLSGANTYTGVTTVNAGTLAVAGGSAISDTGTVTMLNAAGATLQLNSNETIGLVSGGGVTGGNVNLQGNTLTVTTGGAGSFNGTISGTGSVNANLTGTGVFTLAGVNTFQGGLTISGGNGSYVSALSSKALGQAGGNILVQGTGSLLLREEGGGSIVYDSYNLTLNGGGGQYGAFRGSKGDTTWTGPVALASDSRVTTSSISTGLKLTNSVDTAGKKLTLDPNALSAAAITISGEIKSTSGTGSVDKIGAGTVILSGANTYNGDTTISDGTLKAGADNTLPSGTGKGNVVISGTGKLDLNGFHLGINGLSSTSSTANVTNSAAGTGKTLTVGKGDATASFDGAIKDGAGTISLTKEGAGTQTLGGIIANSYSGATTVSGGTLALKKSAGTDAVGSGAILLNSGGTLLLEQSNQINDGASLTLNGGAFSTGTGFNETMGIVTLTGDSSISLANSIHLLNFGDSSLTAWSPTAKLTIYGWSGNAGLSGNQGQIYFGTNTSTLTNTQLANITFANFSPGAQLLGTGELVPTAVPEADAYVAGLLLTGLVVWRERRRLIGLIPARSGLRTGQPGNERPHGEVDVLG